ncbi:MAG: hypothetical protein K9N62_06990 [Verrucomicrobia bacterium]|nr:hypothetical protein [Verrucomicrobiota bacterium]
MEDLIPFGSPYYFANLGVLLFSRGMDFLSTWIATPKLVLEANPIARRIGWKGGIGINAIVCTGLAAWPLPAYVISTMSLLVAARNLQLAWLMRLMGEEHYAAWFTDRLAQAHRGLFLFCLFGQSVLTALVGGALMYFSECAFRRDTLHLVPFSVGMGIVTYALAVTLYTLVAVRRARLHLL